MYCKYCGTQIEDTDRFCLECGKTVGEVYEESQECDTSKQKRTRRMFCTAVCIVLTAGLIGIIAVAMFYKRKEIDSIRVKKVVIKEVRSTAEFEYTENGEFEYTENGKIKSILESSLKANWDYDADGHLISMTCSDEASEKETEIKKLLERIDSKKLENGNSLDEFNFYYAEDVEGFFIEYDQENRIVSMRIDSNGSEEWKFSYNMQGQLERMDVSGVLDSIFENSSSSFSYHENGKLKKVNTSGQDFFMADFDVDGNYRSLTIYDNKIYFDSDQGIVTSEFSENTELSSSYMIEYKIEKETGDWLVKLYNETGDSFEYRASFYDSVPKELEYHDAIWLLAKSPGRFGISAFMEDAINMCNIRIYGWAISRLF